MTKFIIEAIVCITGTVIVSLWLNRQDKKRQDKYNNKDTTRRNKNSKYYNRRRNG